MDANKIFRRIFLILISILLVAALICSCSKSDLEEACERRPDVIVTITPQASGIVQKEIVKNGTLRFLELTAIPNEGYIFTGWERHTGFVDTGNPRFINICFLEQGVTVKVTALFEKIEG